MRLGELAVAADMFAVAATVVERLVAFQAAGPAVLRLADLLRYAGRQDLAAQLAQAGLRRDPGDISAALVLTMSRLAIVHGSQSEIDERREEYTLELQRLEAASATAPEAALAAAASQVGNTKPFFLAYQGKNDRALQEIYGRVLTRITAASGASPPLRPPPIDGRLRIGFASAYFHLHSVSKLFGGWMTSLDPERFAVFGYQFGNASDATSAALAAACVQYTRDETSEGTWKERIAADRLHALIYPEIGMHPIAVRLACNRLAPVQCVAWGHPVTTGLPEIDYFLSSDLMEPPDADAHYTEHLVRLPNLVDQLFGATGSR